MNSAKLQYKKINTQKSLTFLDTNNERAKKETKEAISFTTASKRISLLEINLPMEEKDLYSENCKILKKENKQTDGKIYHVLGLENSDEIRTDRSLSRVRLFATP